VGGEQGSVEGGADNSAFSRRRPMSSERERHDHWAMQRCTRRTSLSCHRTPIRVALRTTKRGSDRVSPTAMTRDGPHRPSIVLQTGRTSRWKRAKGPHQKLLDMGRRSRGGRIRRMKAKLYPMMLAYGSQLTGIW
jgi:hypothetical protein